MSLKLKLGTRDLLRVQESRHYPDSQGMMFPHYPIPDWGEPKNQCLIDKSWEPMEITINSIQRARPAN